MLRLIAILLILLVPSAFASDYEYYLGFKGGLTTISGGDVDKFTLQDSWGGSVGYRLGDQWLLDFDLSVHRNFNDTSANTIFAIGGDKEMATEQWRATRLSMTFRHLLFSWQSRANLSLDLGGGLMIWKMVEPVGDTILDVSGPHNEQLDYSASEIFFTGGGGLSLFLTEAVALNLDFQADYLSGAGAEFATTVSDTRHRWQLGSYVSLTIHFGDRAAKSGWRSDRSWATVAPAGDKDLPGRSIDSDGDGVSDSRDQCENTRFGIIVDRDGCSLDSDGDGVSDGLDDCPDTDRRAGGRVDIFGCPVDSDFDGVPDYRDTCPFNQVGAHVNESGCPLDGDADGVPDGLDDCPNTLFGAEVDQFGCIDLTMLARPMVLNIDYQPGSFEVDPNNQERLKSLVRVLNFVPEIRLEINGYTDNIGTTAANRKLSKKRAGRVREYLITFGVDASRIIVFGRGETNFVADNSTAAGRAKNRRIEINFFK